MCLEIKMYRREIVINKLELSDAYSMIRKKHLDIFANEVYGEIPSVPSKIEADKSIIEGNNYCCGHARLFEITLNCILDNGRIFSFPFKLCLPRKEGKHKTVVLINFKYDVPDKYCPAEEIIDRGWAFAALDYQKITSDCSTIDGLAEIYAPNRETGKISLWAWAVMRIMDYLQTRDDIDLANIGVVGHSRLGKTALWVAANDERFRFVHSNDSGTAGAALYRERNEKSESIRDICEMFPYWFNKTFPKYADMENNMKFDQDMLVGCIAPRIVSIGSASEDLWANPRAEMLCAKSASVMWELCGDQEKINIPDDAEIDVNYHEGKIGYYVRSGRHFLSRNDWNRFLDFFDKNLTDDKNH